MVKTNDLQKKATIADIDIKVEKGEFVCIIGKIGSGKSSLLSAILGEMAFIGNLEKPMISRAGKISYVEDKAWM